jgi:glycosyltransferase involved in cell wall biosynthesis
MKLLIISNMSHYLHHGQIVGWGPTVEEINHLSRLFRETRHIACLHAGPAPLSALPYASPGIHLIPVAPAGGKTWPDKFGILLQTPQYLKKIIEGLLWADMVHLRCPANICLLGIILLAVRTRPNRRWVKFAGNWRPGGPEPWSSTFQRWWLEKGLHQGLVTINGRWPNQPKHIFSFLNPCLTEKEAKEGRNIGEGKELKRPVNFLFVGRIEAAKGVGRLLQVAEELKKRGLRFVLHLVGDGPERPTYERWCREHGLDSWVSFRGWLPRPALADYYARAHFLLLPSASEGWPKVLSEAMAYGVVPLAGAVSSIPQVLADTGAGVALPPFDLSGFINEALALVENPGRWKRASLAGIGSAPSFTYSHYLNELRRVFHQAWGIELPDRAHISN